MYSWEDQRVFTRCCETAIGSHCKAQHIADCGACWNCGKEEIQSEAASAVGCWPPYDPKDFAEEKLSSPLYAGPIPINNANTTTQESQRFLYNGSEPTSSDIFQEDQQHALSLTSRIQKQQEAKQYVIEATKHLLEMCNAYDDEIDDEVMSEILKALRGKISHLLSTQGIH